MNWQSANKWNKNDKIIYRNSQQKEIDMENPSITDQITFLYTDDLLKSVHFYESILGFELTLDQGSCRIYQVRAGAFIGICERKEVEINPENVIFTLVTLEVDEWYERLQGKGVDFEKPPALNPRYQIYHCFLRDPNGYLIEIQRFEDPRWHGA
jgi:catechol 2,3-dioxygenase-like lactoylglutathione lyase family enzyme